MTSFPSFLLFLHSFLSKNAGLASGDHIKELGMAAHTYNLSAKKAPARFLELAGQPVKPIGEKRRWMEERRSGGEGMRRKKRR